jgi:hypothetical protein
LPVTEELADRSLALPFHNRLAPAAIEEVVETLVGASTALSGEGERAAGPNTSRLLP